MFRKVEKGIIMCYLFESEFIGNFYFEFVVVIFYF